MAELPVRTMSVAGGVMTANMTPDWSALLLNGPQLNEIVTRALSAAGTGGFGEETDEAEDATSYAVQVDFYLGKRFVTENTFHNSSSGLSISVELDDRPDDPFDVTGTLKFYELASSIRYNLLTGGLQPYLKVGYGWSWYQVVDMATDGVPLTDPEGPWIRQPTFFPGEQSLAQHHPLGGRARVLPAPEQRPDPQGDRREPEGGVGVVFERPGRDVRERGAARLRLGADRHAKRVEFLRRG